VSESESKKIHVARDLDETIPEGPIGSAPPASPDALAKLQAEMNELRQTLILRQADFENFRKRVERDRHEESRRGISRLLEDLLPVLDGFDRALQSRADGEVDEHLKGILLIQKQLWDVLSKHGLSRIEAEGKHFDPHFHLALDRVETTELPDGTVLEVLQQGYRFHDRVLRPSAVRVAVHPSGRTDEQPHKSKAAN
jgi:molecular chaperone GrpE